MIQELHERPTAYRSLWISDLHLGTKSSRVDCLADFLARHDSEYLYLVGDVVDGWRLRKNWYWDNLHNEVIQLLLAKAKAGTKVVFIPGNHDQFARDFIGHQVGQVDILRQCFHETVDGRRLLVLHGDEFDGIVTYAKGLAGLGSWAYEVSIALNRALNRVRAKLGMPYWSLSAVLKKRVKNAMMFMMDYQKAIMEETRRQQADGVVCGHIHQPAITEVDDLVYYNTGDWVESCTALAEHHDGSMQLVEWITSPVPMPAEGERTTRANLPSVMRALRSMAPAT